MSNVTQSGRRQRARQELDLDDTQEQYEIEQAISKEEERREAKEMRRLEIEDSLSYSACMAISKYMDKYFLDPIIGFFMPGFGDFLTSLLVWPFIYVAAFKVRSLPLTLAVIFNVLRDIAIGLIPFWIGDLLDAFNRGYLQNCRLIVGFVEDDQEVIDEVNGKAWWMGVLIILFCFIIYWLIEFALWVTTTVSDFFSNLF